MIMAIATKTFANAQMMADYIATETAKWPACGDIDNTGIKHVDWTSNTLVQSIHDGHYWDE